jgi:1,4-alpha-glucan branching enzyme
MFKKRFLKTKCKVTFELPQSVAESADEVYLVGDFNNWDEHATAMEKKRGNRFTITLDLEPNREYQYRYLVNGKDWHNDWEADKYVANPFSGDNSVVSTYTPSSSNGKIS